MITRLTNISFYNDEAASTASFQEEMLDQLAEKISARFEPLLASRKHDISNQAHSVFIQKIEVGILKALSDGDKSRTELLRFFKNHVETHILTKALENLQKEGKVINYQAPAIRARRTAMMFCLKD